MPRPGKASAFETFLRYRFFGSAVVAVTAMHGMAHAPVWAQAQPTPPPAATPSTVQTAPPAAPAAANPEVKASAAVPVLSQRQRARRAARRARLTAEQTIRNAERAAVSHRP